MGCPCVIVAPHGSLARQVVAPESCRHCYSEQLALMPNCYFVNDYKRAHLDVLEPANMSLRTEVRLRPSPVAVISESNAAVVERGCVKTSCSV